MGQWFADETEFANRGKLTWQTGKLVGRLGPDGVIASWCLVAGTGVPVDVALRQRRPVTVQYIMNENSSAFCPITN